MGELSAEAPFNAILHALDQIDCADKVDHQPILGHLRKLIFSCQRLIVLIQHGDCQVSGTQVHTHFDLPRRGVIKTRGFWVIYPVKKLSSAA
jgi:hypothetical protein